jgi:hypothetical protein
MTEGQCRLAMIRSATGVRRAGRSGREERPEDSIGFTGSAADLDVRTEEKLVGIRAGPCEKLLSFLVYFHNLVLASSA